MDKIIRRFTFKGTVFEHDDCIYSLDIVIGELISFFSLDSCILTEKKIGRITRHALA